MTAPVPVLFIGGYGRSGSTLLDRLIGAVSDDAASCGELRHLWLEGFRENRRCGCGERFGDCPFWTAVIADGFGPAGPDLDAIEAHKRAVDRVPCIPLLASPRRPAGFQAHLDAYGDALVRVYRSIQRVSGRPIVVDSTKDVAHGWLLRAVDDVDLRVVHLVRDSRAVAWSWQRKTYHPGSGHDMDRWGVTRSAVEWDAINVLTAALCASGVPHLRVRYEDLTADPVATLASVLALAGSDPGAADRVVDGTVELRTDHTVAGNPIRFERGRVALRRDDRWRAAMPARARRLVGGITLPVRAALRV
jgi:hypothetical protein